MFSETSASVIMEGKIIKYLFFFQIILLPFIKEFIFIHLEGSIQEGSILRKGGGFR